VVSLFFYHGREGSGWEKGTKKNGRDGDLFEFLWEALITSLLINHILRYRMGLWGDEKIVIQYLSHHVRGGDIHFLRKDRGENSKGQGKKRRDTRVLSTP